MQCRSLFVLITAVTALPACGFDGHNRVMGSVTVHNGEQAEDVSSVNGGIDIQDGATALDASTVNGSIKLGDSAKADSLKTVNGGITIATLAHVEHDVETVNGSITLAEKAKVGGDVGTVNGGTSLRKEAETAGQLKTVNGRIELDTAHVGGDIETTNGDILVGAGSHVDGGIAVRKNHGSTLLRRDPRIVIGPHAVVRGTLKFERPVKLYVSESAAIGMVMGATVEKYAGSEPPG